MAEMDPFEARFAASLERLASEAPTDVDPVRLAAEIAAAERRRAWPRPWSGSGARQLVPALRLALLLAALLAVMVGLLVLAPRLVRSPFEAMVHGHLTCGGEPWPAPQTVRLVLDCTSELPDPRLAGPVRIVLDEPRQGDPGLARTGSIELHATGASWTGDLGVATAPNGLVAGDAVLRGDGVADGVELHLHLLTADGRAWGIIGSTVGGG